MKPGDLFEWRYKKDEDHNAPYAYHCRSRICIATETGLMDTYWGMTSTDGRHWPFEKAYQKLDLKFLANVKDIEKLEPYNQEFYRPESVVDLRHANGGGLYLQKNTGRDLTATVNFVRKCRDAWQHEKEWAARREQEYQKLIEDISRANFPPVDLNKVYAYMPPKERG